MESSNYVNGVIVEYVEGIEVIKAFNQSSTSYEKFSKAVKSFKDYTLNWYKSVWKLMNFGNSVLPSTFLGTLPVGMILYTTGTLSPENMVMCFILSMGIVDPLMNYKLHVSNVKAVEYAIHDVDKLLHVTELPDSKNSISIENHNIELKNVSFAYSKNKDNKVLSNITFSVPEDSFTALVGPSGSGKSTIARLIARFWDVDEGSISIGGIDIRQIPISQLSDIISFVTQDNFLFHCSIKENIRMGKPSATDEEVYAAAKAACCDDFIQKLEHGYDTQAGDTGNRLSGGEKQRISIARMILKNAPILILDEAMAAVDSENEKLIEEAINDLSKNKTVITIAHHLNTIKNSNQIIVMNKGVIVDRGTHEELMNRCNFYQTMVKAQNKVDRWNLKEEVI